MPDSETPRPSKDPLIGKTFGACRILSRIGGGSFGSVYLAEHTKLQAKRAIKILKPDPDGPDPEAIARFLLRLSGAKADCGPRAAHEGDERCASRFQAR